MQTTDKAPRLQLRRSKRHRSKPESSNLDAVSGAEYTQLLAISDFARSNTFGNGGGAPGLLDRWAEFLLESGHSGRRIASTLMRRREEISTLRLVREQIRQAERGAISPLEVIQSWGTLLPQLERHQHLSLAA